MFVLQNTGGYYAVAVENAKGFNYSESVNDATQYPNSRQAMRALVDRAVHFEQLYPGKTTIPQDEFYLVEVTPVPAVPVPPTSVVRVL